jgi:hypothetical protein
MQNSPALRYAESLEQSMQFTDFFHVVLGRTYVPPEPGEIIVKAKLA